MVTEMKTAYANILININIYSIIKYLVWKRI